MAFEYSKEEWLRHAQFELELGESNEDLKNFYMKMVEAFLEYPHDEHTLYFMPNVLEKLFRHENIMGLSNHPSEWEKISDGVWRNKRNPRAISDDEGETVTMLPRLGENYQNNTIKPTNLPEKIEALFAALGDVKNL